MAKASMTAAIRNGRKKLIATVTALLVLAAQPVFAYELREDVSAWEYECEDKGKYHKLYPFGRKGKIAWLRCGSKKKNWGYRHIKDEHEWGPWPKLATILTVKKGKMTVQGDPEKGSRRYVKKVTDPFTDEKYKWRVIVQWKKTWSGEPGPKGIITSFRED
jgi:hypothetical protein